MLSDHQNLYECDRYQIHQTQSTKTMETSIFELDGQKDFQLSFPPKNVIIKFYFIFPTFVVSTVIAVVELEVWEIE